ncbi:uncharacterized protein FSUBG_3293 [Fusarium subglutinans]|uniref:Uncharacterized protein n=1 Tax=Gibberella subglutinans TaxID=42677 RepID=A0A8H5Q812_GIBSU|nr:uncharacterized protein FSUBG_3293 [Fusarium subglutinans]KAF5610377.1 hypothetical protein FSUBG_3293 [Fusarium subglutinans]
MRLFVPSKEIDLPQGFVFSWLQSVFPGNDHSNGDHNTSDSPSSVPQKQKRTSEDFGEMTPEQRTRLESGIDGLVLEPPVPGSDNEKDFWRKWFDDFRKQSLKQDLKDTPTCRDLERFIRYASERVKVESDYYALRLLCIHTGLFHIKEYLIFQYNDFGLDSYEETRILSTFKELLGNGEIDIDSDLDVVMSGYP